MTKRSLGRAIAAGVFTTGLVLACGGESVGVLNELPDGGGASSGSSGSSGGSASNGSKGSTGASGSFGSKASSAAAGSSGVSVGTTASATSSATAVSSVGGTSTTSGTAPSSSSTTTPSSSSSSSTTSTTPSSSSSSSTASTTASTGYTPPPLDAGTPSGCPTAPCPGNELCCADPNTRALSCAASCDASDVIHCELPSDCSGSTPTCCVTANLTGGGPFPEGCMVGNISSVCEATASCPSVVVPECLTTEQVPLCTTGADCAAGDSCCAIPIGGQTVSGCIDSFYASLGRLMCTM